MGGDSGAWVIDNASGRVCGHVLAERDGLSYICSMQLLFEDMKRTLGATNVSLPGANMGGSSTAEYAAALTEDIAGRVAALDLVGKSARRSHYCARRKHIECNDLAKQRQAQAVRT